MHPIETILNTTMSELKEMVDVNTIVGDPFVTPNGCTVIPISKVSFGFVTGGGEYGESINCKGQAQNAQGNGFPFAGGTASGISITPVAFMTADQDSVKLLSTCHRSVLDKVLENMPQVLNEIKDMISGREGNNSGQQEQPQDDEFSEEG